MHVSQIKPCAQKATRGTYLTRRLRSRMLLDVALPFFGKLDVEIAFVMEEVLDLHGNDGTGRRDGDVQPALTRIAVHAACCATFLGLGLLLLFTLI